MNDGKTLIQVFENTVNRNGEKIAVCLKDERVTYNELKRYAMSIATGLIRYYETHNYKKTVVIAMEKSPMCLATILGVLYSGNSYTIVDVKSPFERVEKILNTLDTKIVMADSKGKKMFFSESNENVALLDLESFIASDVDYVGIEKIQSGVVDMDPAYVLFTSGSTGTPKGVVVGQRSVIAYSRAVAETFSFDEKTTFGNQTPFYFSMSILDVYVTLYTGATLVIIPKMLFSFPLRLFDYLKENRVNTLYWVPTAMELVADRKLFDDYDASFLKTILFAGEPLPPKYLNAWMDALPNAVFANLYGPTEVTDTCTYYLCNDKIEVTGSIPIGRCFENCDVFLLDENDNMIDKDSGKMGEICVRGSFLAYGYYNNKEQTEKAFVQNPLNPFYEEKIYRTGDLGIWKDEENLLCCGRKDNQIKHLGYRIELGEIENALSAIGDIGMIVALYNNVSDEIIVCFNGKVEESYVFLRSKELLPSYMCPAKVIRMDSFPINQNGKIDKKKITDSLNT